MTTRFSPFRSQQSPARRRSCKPHRLGIETLEARQMLAADMLLAGDVLDQEPDAPSDDVSAASMSAIIKSLHDTAKSVIQTSSEGPDAGVGMKIDAAAVDQALEPAGDFGSDGSIELPPDWLIYLFGDAEHRPIEEVSFSTGSINYLPQEQVSLSGGDADDRPTEEVAFTGGDADNRPTEEVAFSTGSINYLPLEQVSFSSDAGVDTSLDAAFAIHEPRLTVALDTTIALQAPVDIQVVDQVFGLDADAAGADLNTTSSAVSLEGGEGDQGDAGMNGSSDGLLESEPGAETTGPDDTGIQFGLTELIWDIIIWWANRKG